MTTPAYPPQPDRPLVLVTGEEPHALRSLTYLLDRGGFRPLAVPGLAEAARLAPLFCRALDGALIDADAPDRLLCHLIATLRRHAPELQPLLLEGPGRGAPFDLPKLEKPVDPEALLARCRACLPRPPGS